VLERAVAGVAGAFDAGGSTLTMNLTGGALPDVLGDDVALEQLFMNLLLNAAQAAPRGGHAAVNVLTSDSVINVRISDTGAGLPEQLRGSAPQPFRSSKRGGTGLGLSIATKIAEAHGGSLLILSGDEGGTTVIVTLPQLH
jgi:signal transduction histidine kinase